MPVVQPTSYRQNYEAPKTSGEGSNAVREIKPPNAVAANTRVPVEYADPKTRRGLENDLDDLLKQIFPDLGLKFRIHDSGNVITTIKNTETDEVVREFPAEKILDIIHSMTQRIGAITNKKV